MCPPTYFGIEYEINPWMDVNNKTDLVKAGQQWTSLQKGLEATGLEVKLLEPVKGLPDLCFVDVGLTIKDVFIGSNFFYPERQPEAKVAREFFQREGYEVKQLADYLKFEGHGDSLWGDDKDLFVGYGFRTMKESVEELEAIIKQIDPAVKLYPIKLTDERYYHLDTAFCPLPGGKLIYNPKAIADSDVKWIEEKFETFSVPEEEAVEFVTNSQIIGNRIFMPRLLDSTAKLKTRRQMEEWGFEVHEYSMSEFIKAGGACKCLSMPY
jgi:N-dimethylarginine dimethylaminohydrolase